MGLIRTPTFTSTLTFSLVLTRQNSQVYASAGGTRTGSDSHGMVPGLQLALLVQPLGFSEQERRGRRAAGVVPNGRDVATTMYICVLSNA